VRGPEFEEGASPASSGSVVRPMRRLGARRHHRCLMSVPRSRHRDVGATGVRAAVLGAGDGLLANVALVLGIAGANPPASSVRLAGLAGLLAGAFSMAAGELVPVQAQPE